MAFALGVAIADEFRRIAELLAMRPQFPPLPTPGGGGGGTSPPPGGPGSGGTPPSPPPPGTGQPPLPLPPPRVVTVPWGNVFPAPPPQAVPCPLFAPTDYLTLLEVERQSRAQGITIIPPGLLPGQGGQPVGQSFGVGVPVESNDFFRFRAYGTAPATPVSFFGRVQRTDGVIVPFNHTLTTDSISTIEQTLPQTGAGLLLGAAASVPIGSVATGAVFAVGEIGRIAANVFTPHTLLFSGQLNDQQPLSSTLASPAAPVANPTLFELTNAGPHVSTLDIAITPNAGKRVRVIRVGALFTASAAGTPRGLSCRFLNGSSTFWRGLPGQNLPLSNFVSYNLNLGSQTNSQTPTGGGITTPYNCPLPEQLYITQTFTVRMIIENGAAGDAVQTMVVGYEET